jgi:TatD DNase family protein
MYIDAHAHLDKYDETLSAVLNDIRQHQILTISNSMDLPSYERNTMLGRLSDLIIPTFGIHPWNALAYVDRLDDLYPAICQSRMIGEIGLDYHFIEDARCYPAQRTVFEYFLTLARKQGKIVNIHTKGAERDIAMLLKRYGIQRTIVHWYSGPLPILQDLIATGAYFTIGVELLFSEHIQAIAAAIPMEQLLTETDNPGGYQWLTGTPGMPGEVVKVVRALAELRKTPLETLNRVIQTNFRRLIQHDPWLSPKYLQMLDEGENMGPL